MKYVQNVLKLGKVWQKVIIFSYCIWTIKISLDFFYYLNDFYIKILSIKIFSWIVLKMYNYYILYY